MADTAKVVRFGLTNLHYAPLDEETDKYSTPVRVRGAVNMTTTAEGSSSTFNADNGAYYVTNANNGYSGSIEIAATDDQMLIDLFGFEKDANGMIVEFSDAVAKPCALLFEVSSNLKPQRFVLYNVTFSRPSQNANTTGGDSTDPDTITLEFTAVSKDFEYGAETRPSVKGHLTKTTDTATDYGNFFNAVMEPSKLSV